MYDCPIIFSGLSGTFAVVVGVPVIAARQSAQKTSIELVGDAVAGSYRFAANACGATVDLRRRSRPYHMHAINHDLDSPKTLVVS
ncbi:hypothetical protein B0T14DRAFT_529014 [Immersiella caudata]|uniref:Uncharacterized protein n=1 Tax=Immersiella caudata TaxID=314043 RepID=A0AA39WG52_9PEZI|nr:hypothetical protein B0T14DRAFT_529014 [Immersiella caudata]